MEVSSEGRLSVSVSDQQPELENNGWMHLGTKTMGAKLEGDAIRTMSVQMRKESIWASYSDRILKSRYNNLSNKLFRLLFLKPTSQRGKSIETKSERKDLKDNNN